MSTTIILLVWIACTVLAYGLLLATAQRHYPHIARQEWRRDRFYCTWLAQFGPMTLIAILAVYLIDPGKYHGLMYRNPHRGEG